MKERNPFARGSPLAAERSHPHRGSRRLVGILAVVALGLLLANWVALGVLLRRNATAPSSEYEPRSSLSKSIATPLLLDPSPTQAPLPTPIPGPVDIVAVGDIADCASQGDEMTAALVQGLDGTVLALGDNVYESGTAKEFEECYDLSWGQFLDRTRAVPGNHDYRVPDAAAMFSYMGDAAGPTHAGYYSFDLGAWHLIALNSNCAQIDCRPGGPEVTWLEADLADHRSECTMAFWHHPRFTSGDHGDDHRMGAIWRTLVAAGADVVLVGHDHEYERFAPLDADGHPNPTGTREFVIGTGGRSLSRFITVHEGSEVRDATTYGVLTMVLSATAYEWEFLPVEGGTFHDSGSGACH